MEVAAPCDSAVASATSQCRTNVEKARKTGDAICASLGKNWNEVKQKVAKLRREAAEQEQKIKAKEAALVQAQGKAKELAGESKKQRTKLVADLKVQKAAKKKVQAADKKVDEAKAKLNSLKGADEKAMADAVQKAKTPDSKTAVSAAKNKAHKEYRKVLDQKISVATTERAVPKAKKVLQKETAKVEVAIDKTKKVAIKESDQLKKVATDKLKVLQGKLKKAHEELAAAKKAAAGLSNQKGALQNGANRAGADAKQGDATLTKAQKGERAAKSAERKTKAIKLKVGKLDKKKLREEAKKHALAGTMPGAPAPPPMHARYQKHHNTHQAKAKYHQVKANLAQHKMNGAPAHVIAHADSKVKEAQRALNAGSIGARVAAVTQMHSSQQDRNLRETNSAISSQVDHIVGHK